MKTPILTALLLIVNILPAVSATTASFTPQFTQADNTISQPSQYRDSIVLFDDDDEDDDEDELSPAQILFNKGVEKYNSGDKRDAILYFNKAIELAPKYAHAYYARGNTKINLGDKRGAISDFNKAISFKSNYAEAYQYRGVAKSMLGDNRSALVDLRRAADIFRQQGKMENYQRVMASIREISG
jgi:tetratricopeptide (TPR) repeat protein